jgi:hypothetical protein
MVRYARLGFLVALSLLWSSGSIAVPVIVSGGPENDYESWILRLNDNRLMVIFDRNPDWASGDLYVTFSSDDGATWDSALTIIEEQGDQATLSFVQLPSGTLQLWYASNESGSYGIYTARSSDGIHWSPEGKIDLGWQAGITHYDPTVILEEDSSMTMSYVVQGMGAYIAHCPYGGDWDTLKTLVGTSGYRPRVMKHDNGTYLYAYHRRSGPGQYDYDVFVRTSTNRMVWTDSVRLTDNLNSHDPFPNQAPDGAYLVYYAKYQAPAYNLHRRRSYDAVNWEPEEQITSDQTNNTQPHFFCESDDIYLVWAHCVSYPLDHDVYFERSTYASISEELRQKQHSFSFSVYPHPCVRSTQIIINGVPSPRSDITVEVFNIAGRKVRKFSLPAHSSIPAVINWNGSDGSGYTVPTGSYLVQVRYGAWRISRMVTFIH